MKKIFRVISAALVALATFGAMEAATADTLDKAVGISAPIRQATNGTTGGETEFVDQKGRLVISGDLGGVVIDYIMKYNRVRHIGQKVKIDDVCISACTLVNGLVPAKDICVSPNAMFAFHSASLGGFGFSEEGTKILWAIYPANVKAELIKRGWVGPTEHPNLIWVPASTFYTVCED